jgi:hypothetical protein
VCETPLRELKETFQNIAFALERFPLLERVFSRMNLMSLRQVHEDTMIDIFICFEFLVRACHIDNKVYTNAHVIAAFIANLLGSNAVEQRLVYGDLLKGYKIRNRIVHADNPRNDEREVALQMNNTLRRALKELIRNPELTRRHHVEWIFPTNVNY